MTAFVLGMQVKSGTSYALAEGGRIPVREHGHYWRTSTLPIFVCTVVDSGIFVEDAFAVLSIEPNATLIPCRSELSLSTQHLRLRARVQALVPDLAPTLRATSRRVVANNSFAELCDTYAEMGQPRAWPTVFGLSEVVRLLWRDKRDRAYVFEYFSYSELRATSLLFPFFDACAQWSVVMGLEELRPTGRQVVGATCGTRGGGAIHPGSRWSARQRGVQVVVPCEVHQGSRPRLACRSRCTGIPRSRPATGFARCTSGERHALDCHAGHRRWWAEARSRPRGGGGRAHAWRD